MVDSFHLLHEIHECVGPSRILHFNEDDRSGACMLMWSLSLQLTDRLTTTNWKKDAMSYLKLHNVVVKVSRAATYHKTSKAAFQKRFRVLSCSRCSQSQLIWNKTIKICLKCRLSTFIQGVLQKYPLTTGPLYGHWLMPCGPKVIWQFGPIEHVFHFLKTKLRQRDTQTSHNWKWLQLRPGKASLGRKLSGDSLVVLGFPITF